MAVSAEGLASAVKGRVVEAGAPGYNEARALYNAMIGTKLETRMIASIQAVLAPTITREGYARLH